MIFQGTVSKFYLKKITQYVGRMNNKAEKWGLPKIHFQVLRETVVYFTRTRDPEKQFDTTEDPHHPDLLGPCYEAAVVEIGGEPPSLGNWEFLAKLVPNDDFNLVKPVPGFETEIDWTPYIEKVGICEHCNTLRRRKDTFIVRNKDTGETKAVGRACIKDFLGHTNPEAMLDFVTMMSNLRELFDDYDKSMSDDWERGPKVAIGCSISRWLEVAACMIRKDGFVSVTRGQNEMISCTSGLVARYLFDHRGDTKWKDAYEIVQYDKDLAQEVITWGRAIDDPRHNSVMHNIRNLMNAETVYESGFAVLTYAVHVYLTNLSPPPNKNEQVQHKKSLSEHVGTLNTRQTMHLKCISKTEIPSEYGTKCLHRFMDMAGNIVIWWARPGAQWLDISTRFYVVDCNVTKHDEFNGVKQTTVQRVKVREA